MDAMRKLVVALGVALAVAGCGDDATVGAAATPDEQVTSPAPEETVAETTRPSPDGEPEQCIAESEDRYQGRALVSVTEPCAGDPVTSPLSVVGEANVFEATVSMRILDQNGDEIASDFTTAECGTGCWGAFVGEIEFEVDSEQPGTLEVFESSAEDGSDIHKLSIPITLVP
jgi:hypothetical protein